MRSIRLSRLRNARRRLILLPLRAALRALRQGVAQPHHVDALRRAFRIAAHMDTQGKPLGMAGHFAAAAQAVDEIRARASDTSTDLPDVPHLAELEVLQTAIDLHAYQLIRMPVHHYAIAADSVAAHGRCSGVSTSIAAHPVTERLPL